MKPKRVAVSWVSFNHDPYEREKDGSYRERDGAKREGPTLEFLLNPASPVAGQVGRLYVLARRPRAPEPDPRRVHPTEAEVVGELLGALSALAATIEVEVFWWDTDATPTDHRDLFIGTATALVEVRRANPQAEIVVNLSPGTPAMQTVMLLALQARLAGEHVRAFQGTPPDRRRSPRDVAREVPWNLLAELAAIPTEGEIDSRRSTEWTLERARSSRLREVAALVERFGSVPFPVLILGARGTGKTFVAQRLRDSFREWTMKSATGWEFHLNCAEFRGDPNMLRSALFGHVKGAHSTAFRDEAGLLEKAAEDCVFLDEIHWMDGQAQGLLLLALQRNGSLRRIGADKPTPARFRLLAATNQPRTVLRERLTPDFLDRISDLVIEMPDLRDCREDLGDIWKSVVRRACEELALRDGTRAGGKGVHSNPSSLAAEFRPHQGRIEKVVSDMRLPGNFRDLERLARRLLVAGLARGRFFSLKEDVVREELDRLRKEERVEADQDAGDATLLAELPTQARCEDFLREVRDAGAMFSAPGAVGEWERRLLIAAHAVAGSGAQAAGLVGMNPRTFNAKMEKWDGGGDQRPTQRRRAGRDQGEPSQTVRPTPPGRIRSP